MKQSPMLTARNRKLLLVFPKYSPSFGTFEHALPLLGARAFMPPQGLLTVAALMPDHWEKRFLNENIQIAGPDDFSWADAVLISGMHAQRKQILDINKRAHGAGKLTVLGGPSVSAAPEFYPELDILHCGEVGDATNQLVQMLDETIRRPGHQIILRTAERFTLAELPSPAYSLARLRDYMTISIQFSSGCPHQCEFCDIPALYGRQPRFKTPLQIISELDQISTASPNEAHFVDDNFIASPGAAMELLPHLIEWQRLHNYPLQFSCEATLDIACRPELLELMRKAGFVTVFCGIETPEPQALQSMNKTHNLKIPILEAIKTINSFGIEVAAGIILGLDSDNARTAPAIIDFVRQSQIPLIAVNLLYALPHTPLYERLAKSGRIVPDQGRDSNVLFAEPYEVAVERWLQVISEIYSPTNLFARFATQSAQTYCRRIRVPNPWKRLTLPNLRKAIEIILGLVWKLGIRGDYRKEFWKMVGTEAKNSQVATILHTGVVAHHLITYARECSLGKMPSSNYSRFQGKG